MSTDTTIPAGDLRGAAKVSLGVGRTMSTTAAINGATPVRVVFEAEILRCADTGRGELVADDQVVSPDELRAQIARARAALDQAEKLADTFEAIPAPSPCFSWCAHGDEHPGEHESAPVQLAIPAAVVNGPEPLELISAVLFHEDDCWDTGVSVNPPGGLDGAMLHGDEIDVFADSLVVFAGQIRRMRQQANETRPGYDTEAVTR